MKQNRIKELDLSTGEFHLLVLFNSLGHRTGYVGLHKNDFKNKYHLDEEDLQLSIDVHGGVTWADFIEEEKEDYIYIGFDCAHYNDATDMESLKFYFPEASNIAPMLDSGEVRTKEYVIEQTINMLEQIVSKENSGFRTYCKMKDRIELYAQWLANALPADLDDDVKLIMRLNNIEGDE
jgi:hypothetical protein